MSLAKLIPFAQAFAAYTTEFKESHAPSSNAWLSVRACLHRYEVYSRVSTLRDITRYTVESFLRRGSHRDVDTKWMRGFLTWCNQTYGLTLYVPPEKNRHKPIRNPQLPINPADQARFALWRDDTEKAAKLMTLPHQRLIFLLGYYYSFPLSRQIYLTIKDFEYIPMTPTFYALLERVYSLAIESRHWFLRSWLGPSPGAAPRRWKEWVGKDLPFAHIIQYGKVIITDHGGRPSKASELWAKTYWASRSPLDKEILERIEWRWE